MSNGLPDNIEVKDYGWKQIKRELERMKRSSTLVGYWSSGGDPSKSIAARAAVQEYGATIGVTPRMRGYFLYTWGQWLAKNVITIPSRPFMRMTYDEGIRTGSIMRTLAKEYDGILTRKHNAKGALARVGEWYTGKIKSMMRRGNFAPLSGFTVEHRKKKSTKPLIDTGQMRNAITHREVMI